MDKRALDAIEERQQRAASMAQVQHSSTLSIVIQQDMTDLIAELRRVNPEQKTMTICHCDLSGEVHIFREGDGRGFCDICEGPEELTVEKAVTYITAMNTRINELTNRGLPPLSARLTEELPEIRVRWPKGGFIVWDWNKGKWKHEEDHKERADERG